ncbi:hypothetical protein F5X96DRAFT_344365 [Biscogniauxia mediterranea]|nr:hypothetical protein F5X96DRAFT_344365 [Biscogniauxia mediterranea]
MPAHSPSPPLARLLLVAILLAFGFLVTVTICKTVTTHPLERRQSTLENDSLSEHLNTTEVELARDLRKRSLGLGAIPHIIPSAIANLIPGVASSLANKLTSDINSIAPTVTLPSLLPSDGVPLLTTAQPTLPVVAQPEPTGAEVGDLVDKLGSLLHGLAPTAAASIIAAVSSHADEIASSVQAVAIDVASIANQVAGDQVQAPNALSAVGGLLDTIDSSVRNIVDDVTSNLASELPSPLINDLAQAVSSGLGDIVAVSNGPVSLVGDLIEQNICGITTVVDGVVSTIAGICGDMASAAAVQTVPTIDATVPASNTIVSLTAQVPDITVLSGQTGPTDATTPALPTLPTSTTPNPGEQSIASTSSSTTGSTVGIQTNSQAPTPSTSIGNGPISSSLSVAVNTQSSVLETALSIPTGGVLSFSIDNPSVTLISDTGNSLTTSQTILSNNTASMPVLSSPAQISPQSSLAQASESPSTNGNSQLSTGATDNAGSAVPTGTSPTVMSPVPTIGISTQIDGGNASISGTTGVDGVLTVTECTTVIVPCTSEPAQTIIVNHHYHEPCILCCHYLPAFNSFNL